jgi:hypothetical protein
LVRCRSAALIERAHRWRKVLGGAMRQSGLLAAACLCVLDHNVERLAQGFAEIEQVKVLSVATNMVFAQFPEADRAPLEVWLKARGILTQMLYAPRFVTHGDVSRADVGTLVGAVKRYVAGQRGGRTAVTTALLRMVSGGFGLLCALRRNCSGRLHNIDEPGFAARSRSHQFSTKREQMTATGNRMVIVVPRPTRLFLIAGKFNSSSIIRMPLERCG